MHDVDVIEKWTKLDDQALQTAMFRALSAHSCWFTPELILTLQRFLNATNNPPSLRFNGDLGITTAKGRIHDKAWNIPNVH
jgi:hypothetical protein